MEASREARMQQRMRGAQRHQVQDVSFGPFFTIPEPEPEASAQPSSPAPRTTPNTSAKRRRLDSDPAVPPISPSRLSAPPQPEATSAPRSSKGDPYQLPEGDSADEIEAAPQTTPRQGATQRVVPRSGGRDGSHATTSRASGVATLMEAEEVGESPADAPGSGQRRRVRISGAASSSARLHDALLAGEDTVETTVQDSSPLTRKSRTSDHPRSARSTKSAPRRSTRLSGGSEVDVSPEASVASPARRRRKRVSIAEPLSDEVDLSIDQSSQQNQVADEDEEVAEEIDDNEAARQLGRKRPRRSVAEPSSELGSEPSFEEPAGKRRRKAAEKRTTKKQTRPKASAEKTKPATTRRRRSTEATGAAISIEVQRFVAPEVQENEEDDPTPLVTKIPEADRKDVNAIDVLSQMCEEIVGHSIESLAQAAANAQNSAEKREIRTKLRALEAFREELRTRFLEHTIALDTLFSLKKRVRNAQKEKLSLRNDIIQIRSERNQIALKMDAARIKHEEDSSTALHHIQMSSAMHDIDLAVEAGLAAPELTAKERKAAPPANLDLLISRISSQVSGRDTGVLKEIRNFNAFLERAAIVLEAR